MGRTCVRTGCGIALLKPNGTPDFRRIHCSENCRRLERLEKLRAKRAALKNGKCPYCGRQSSGDARFRRGVKLHTPYKTGVSKKAGRGTAGHGESRS